jgi:hypothetical protein
MPKKFLTAFLIVPSAAAPAQAWLDETCLAIAKAAGHTQ